MQKQGSSEAAKQRSSRPWQKRLAIVCAVMAIVICLLTASFFLYFSDYYHAGAIADSELSSDGKVTVSQGSGYLAFGSPDAQTGFIFYPGAKVEYRSYAPLMHLLSEKGYLCIIVDMPFNFAFFDINAADRVIDAYPSIRQWWIGGHSLGGAVAASYAESHTGELEGLVLLASYPASDLSDTQLRVCSIYGSEDDVVNHDKIEETRSYMPQTYTEHVIEGGNHAQFGDYGQQDGDGQASIAPESQWRQAASILDQCFSDAATAST